MTKTPKDVQTFFCMYCGHIWQLICRDRFITDDEFKEWIENVKKEHEENCDK